MQDLMPKKEPINIQLLIGNRRLHSKKIKHGIFVKS